MNFTLMARISGVAFALAFLALGCTSGDVTDLKVLKSPDGKRTAISWLRSGGGGPGWSFGHVSIFEGDPPKIAAGDRGNVFVCQRSLATARWISNSELEIGALDYCKTESWRMKTRDEYLGVRIKRTFIKNEED